jgi:hypothetical protein
MTHIDVHIEELVLYGFPAGDRDAIGDALRERLAVLLSAGPPSWRDRTTVDAGRFSPGTTPRQTGERIAATIHRGLR